MKPSPYFVRYEDPKLFADEVKRKGSMSEADPASYVRDRDFMTRLAAIRFAEEKGGTAHWRKNIRRSAVEGTWDFETEEVE